MALQCWEAAAILSDGKNITVGTNCRVSEFTGLDACEEAQIEASRDLDGLQSHRGGCENEGDGKDLLGIHH